MDLFGLVQLALTECSLSFSNFPQAYYLLKYTLSNLRTVGTFSNTNSAGTICFLKGGKIDFIFKINFLQ